MSGACQDPSVEEATDPDRVSRRMTGQAGPVVRGGVDTGPSSAPVREGGWSTGTGGCCPVHRNPTTAELPSLGAVETDRDAGGRAGASDRLWPGGRIGPLVLILYLL
jgi:hypothetical protein